MPVYLLKFKKRNMSYVPERLVVYVKDVRNITGQSYRNALRILNKIRNQYNYTDTKFVSVEHFSLFSGIPEWKVREEIKKYD